MTNWKLFQVRNNDFLALTCAQNRPLPEYENAISETCEQVLWKFKYDLTKDVDHQLTGRIKKVAHINGKKCYAVLTLI